MTHKELLAKIDHMWDDDFDYVIEQNRKALRTVVELHKPGRTAMVTGEVVCDGCDAGDNHYSNFYPCPTIQAIEKELK